MNTTKVILTMIIPGATMMSEEQCKKLPKKEGYDSHIMTLATKVKKDKKLVVQKEVFHINTRKSIPAKRVLCISDYAYKHMINSKEVPEAKYIKTWNKMNNSQKLEYYLNSIAFHFGALSFNYTVLEN